LMPLRDPVPDPRLQAVIERWSYLPEAIRCGIEALVRASC
jgi:hypothetical protein